MSVDETVNIKGFRLVNGERILGVIKKVSKDGITLSLFLPVTVSEQEEGWFLDYLDKSSKDQLFKIPKGAILYEYDVADGIIKSYVESFLGPVLKKAFPSTEPSTNVTEEGVTGQ